ncbi:hypothetical protein G9A89_018843 [Geosiphon pyriformis]|nr:hypothetical protein G9A89_018843 [Geosiphon pyriformis]
MIELVGISAGGSGSLSVRSGSFDSVYSCGLFFKKPNKPGISGTVVDLSAGSLFAEMLQDTGIRHDKSWSSEIESKESSVSGVSDMENLKNTVAKETSYIDSNTSKTDDMMNDTTPRKTQTRTYVLEQLPKVSFFVNVSNDNNELVFLVPKFVGFNWLLSAGLHVLDKRDFRPIKSFMLDVELSAVSGKTNSDKLMAIKKIFYRIDGFGGVSTSSKFLGIIRFFFTSKLSLKKARDLAIYEKIVVNIDVRQINKHSDWVIVVKKISVDLPKSAIKSVFSKFGKIVLIKIQLIGLWQKVLVEFESSEIADLVTARWSVFMGKNSVYVAKADLHRTLLYTFPVGTMVHDLSVLLESYGGKTCFIGCNPSSYVYNRCAIVCFADEPSKLAVIDSTLVFKSVNLHWAGHFWFVVPTVNNLNSGVYDKQVVISQDWVYLANIYRKKQVPIIHSVFFGEKTWVQVAGGSSSCVVSSGFLGPNLSSDIKPVLMNSNSLAFDRSGFWYYEKSSFVELVPLASKLFVSPPVVLTSVTSNLDSNMALNITMVSPFPFFLIVTDLVADLGLSSSKVLISKIGGLESKIVALEVSVESVLEKLDCLCSGLGSGFVWNFVMCNVHSINVSTKQEDIIRDRFSRIKVFSSGLDKRFLGAGVAIIMNTSLAHHVCKVFEVSGQLLLVKLLFKNKLSVFILGLYAGASLAVHFSQANDINSMIVKAVNKSLFVVLDGNFNENDSQKSASFKKCLNLGLAVSVFVDLGRLLDAQLNSFHKQKNFKNAILVNAVMFSDKFAASVKFSDLDAIFDNVFTKKSSKYHKLELLVSKIVKASHEKSVVNFESLMKYWVSLDSIRASVVQNIVDSGASSGQVCSAHCGAKKAYHTSKLAKSCRTKEATIKATIDKRMKSFEINKSHTIRSVLEHLFHKVVLNHLVVNNKLVLKPNLVKSKCHQYQPLEYIFNEAFLGVMCSIKFNELFGVVFSLPDDKAAGLSAHKILLDRILLVYSAFNVLCEDNFSVLKSTLTQSPIFVIGSVIEDALEKNRELWLVLQNIRKAYDLDCTNCIMTDFSLTGGYQVHNSLDQNEVFSPLLWHIFYNPLLCEIKHQESICKYKLNSHFIFKNDHAESRAELSFFFAASAFVDDTIWVGSSQNATQHILDVVGEFFWINNISINNDKTVAISINSRSEPHQYLGIFLLTKSFSKPSLAKTNSDIYFFTNLVLQKTVSDKQLLYLVSAGLKLKSGLPLDFSSDMVYHPFFYGLKSFSQVQSESKVVSFVSFANSGGVVNCLFSHKSHDLQVLCWHSVHPLSSSVCIHISASNNFLAGMVHVLFNCDLSLGSSLTTPFQFYSGVSMSAYWKRLDPHGSILEWFKLSIIFLNSVGFSSALPSLLYGVGSLNILESSDFVFVCNHLSQASVSSLSVYMDKSLSNLGTASCKAGAVTYFEDISLGLGVCVLGLMLFTLAELQAIALALECVPPSSSVLLFLESQFALNTCKSKLSLACPDFHNQCWVKRCHISYFGISGNKCTDAIAGAASLSNWHFSLHLDEYFLIADGGIVFGNSRHFVHDIYCSVCHACWEVGFGFKFLAGCLLSKVDWFHSLLVWHSNLHMAASFTSKLSADACTYFMKALHHWLLVAVWKRLYSRLYLSVLCLYCGEIKVSNHVFSCKAVSGLSHFSLGAVSIFHDLKVASLRIVEFVHSFSLAFRADIWSVCAKHCAYIEKNRLISLDGSAFILVSGLTLVLSAGMVKLLGIADGFAA